MARRDFKIERKINLGRDMSEGGSQLAVAIAIGAAVMGVFAFIAALVAANS